MPYEILVPSMLLTYCLGRPPMPRSHTLQVQSAAAIGSFSCGVAEGVRQVVQLDAVTHLVSTLVSSGDDRVVEAAVRSLKLIYQVSGWVGLAGSSYVAAAAQQRHCPGTYMALVSW